MSQPVTRIVSPINDDMKMPGYLFRTAQHVGTKKLGLRAFKKVEPRHLAYRSFAPR